MTLDETTDFATGDRVFTLRVPHKELALLEGVVQSDDLRLIITALRNSPKLSAKLGVLALIAQVFESIEARRGKPKAPGDEWFGGN